MLQSIRDRLSGPIVWVIVGLIAVPFAFWGIESFQSGGGDPTVANIGDQKITESQLQAAYDQRLRQLQEMLGESFRADMIEPAKFRDGVLQEMLQEAALRQHAKQTGYAVSDASILSALGTIPAFQKDGRFAPEAYRAALARQGLSAQRFETQMRDGLTVDQVRDSVLASAFVTSAESAAAWRLARQERTFSYVIFKTANYEAAINPTEDEVAKKFAAGAARYNAPERLKLQYVELALDELPAAAAPGMAVLKAVYDGDLGKFSSAEERHASHILINFGADKNIAHEKVQAIKAKLDGGANFSALAKEFSDDPGSKAAGGDLGWVRRGLMTPKFESALFGLTAGAISEPVETEFGWHLIRLDTVKPAIVKPFEDASVQTELLSSYRRRDAEKRYQDAAEKLGQISFENSSSLEPVAKELKLQVKSTEWFTRSGGSGIAAIPEVLKAAFAPELIKDGENSKPVANGENRQVVFRKAEYEAPRPRKLEEVAEQIRSELRAEQARARANSEADALVKDLSAGESFEAVTTRLQLHPVSAGSVRRDAEAVDRQILSTLFKLPRPSSAKLQIGKVVLSNGDVSVLALAAVRDATPATNDPAFQKESNQLRDALAGAEFAGFRSGLEKSLGVSKQMMAVDKAAVPEPVGSK